MQDFSPTVAPPRQRSRSVTLFVAVVAFILGAALVAWAVSGGYLARILPAPDPQASASLALDEAGSDEAVIDAQETGAPEATAAQLAAIGTVEGRLALLEERLSRVDYESAAASGNAARAEGLLIAFAARRLIDRGEPLGFVADQLRLRFMDAQPRSVETVLAFSRKPVTLDELTARLEALSPDLTETRSNQSLWDQAAQEIGSIFTVRTESPALMAPASRIDRAKVMLTAGRIDNAVGEVERLPGAEAANTWIADARRYQQVQQALDLLETTAMLDPRGLHDAAGQQVTRPSPLAAPTARP